MTTKQKNTTSGTSFVKKQQNQKFGNESIVKKSKTLRIGDVCDLKINGLAPNNIGFDDVTYPYTVFVPNATYGSVIKAKVLKIKTIFAKSLSASEKLTVKGKNGKKTIKKTSYIIAQLISEVKSGMASVDFLKNQPVSPGQTLTVSPNTSGVVQLSSTFRLMVPILPGAEVAGGNVKVIVTRVKENYGFAKLDSTEKSTSGSQTKETSLPKSNLATMLQNTNPQLGLGVKFTTTIPSNAPIFGKYAVVKMNDLILFVKLQKGIALGEKVRVKIISTSKKYAVAKILKVNPLSQNQKTILVMNSIRDMINHGLHFGEKAVKCHARMKNFIWLKKQGQNKNRPLIKKGRHIINLLKTRRCLNKALNALTKYALKGRTFLFIGTKKPATGLVARASFFTKNSFYVNTRWLGGMLTNWKTICKSISKIRPILKEKQKVVRDILERRQTIKGRLIKKALLLKKKSKLILTKGRFVLNLLKNTKTKNDLSQRAQKLTTLRNEFVTKGMEYLQKRQKLIQKRRELIYQTLLLKDKASQIVTKYKAVLKQLASYTKKLREYKYLLILTSEIQQIKLAFASKNLYSVSYGKLKEMGATDKQGQSTVANWIIPNPPKEILNRIVLTMKNQYEQESNTVLGGKSTTTENSVAICSALLTKFSRFNNFIKSVIQNLIQSIKSLETQANFYEGEFNKIKTTLNTYSELKTNYVQTLQKLKTKLITERKVITILKRKLKALDAQKKLIKFLPRLRYLPTPQTKISQIVQILLSKIVDPKFKYPIDNIYDQKLSTSSKKLAAARKKKWQRLEKYFGGIANMTKLTKTNISRNVAIIIGQKEEMNAVRECQKLGIQLFTIVDTNCNPTLSDHIIPANDDSRNSIKYILTKMITHIRLAQKLRTRFERLKKTV